MDGLEFKSDWNDAKEKWRAWWHRQHIYRCFLSVYAPREAPAPAEQPEESGDWEVLWTDVDRIIRLAERRFPRVACVGQNFPLTTASLGPGAFGVYVGAKPVFEPTTIWYEPCFDDVKAANITFDRQGKWWQWTLETTRRLVERSANQTRFLVAMPDLIENADTLAALLGTESLLYYMMDAPDDVLRLQEQLLPLWYEAFDGIYDLIKTPDAAMAFMAFDIWAPGRLAKLQCDYSAMISPAMFEKFVVPWLVPQCDWLDYSIYHLDGPGAVCHLDLLMRIEGLDCLQWTPGAGAPDGGDPCWDAIYRKALDSGKLAHAHMPADKVVPFVKRFGRNDIYIITHAKTEPAAPELVAAVEAV